jgi:hypothetical protein
MRTEIYSRVVGYFRPIQQWNKGKQEEFKNRKPFKVPGSKPAIAERMLKGMGASDREIEEAKKREGDGEHEQGNSEQVGQGVDSAGT